MKNSNDKDFISPKKQPKSKSLSKQMAIPNQIFNTPEAFLSTISSLEPIPALNSTLNIPEVFLKPNPIFESIYEYYQAFNVTLFSPNDYTFITNLFNNPLISSFQEVLSSPSYNNFINAQYIWSDISNYAFTILDDPSLYNDFQTEIKPDINKIIKIYLDEQDFLIDKINKFIKEQPPISADIFKNTSEGNKIRIILAVISGLAEVYDIFPPNMQNMFQVFIEFLIFLLIYYSAILFSKV